MVWAYVSPVLGADGTAWRPARQGEPVPIGMGSPPVEEEEDEQPEEDEEEAKPELELEPEGDSALAALRRAQAEARAALAALDTAVAEAQRAADASATEPKVSANQSHRPSRLLLLRLKESCRVRSGGGSAAVGEWGRRDMGELYAERLAPDHPGLAGKDLTPLGLLELGREE